MEGFSECHLLLVKALIILGRRTDDTVVLRAVGLDQHLPRRLISSGPACRLGQKLKSPLPAPEIRGLQGEVCRQNPNQRHIGKIMALHDHLGADEDIRLPMGKGG